MVYSRSEALTVAIRKLLNLLKDSWKFHTILRRLENKGSIYKLDTETKESTVFRNPRALGCSDPSGARALLRARGFLNTVDPVGRGI